MSTILSAKKLRGSLKMLADVGGRDGLIGQYFILGNDRQRAAYWRLKSRLRRADWERRRQLATQLPHADDLAIPRDVGFIRLAPGRFPEVPQIVHAARALVQSIDARASRKNSKNYLYGGLLDNAALSPESPFVRFALRADLIAAVSTYMGALPVLADIDILVSPSPEPGAAPEGSQLYHCDWDDVSQIKVFVYASDVRDPAGGPLTLLDARSSQSVRDRLDYRYGYTFRVRHGLGESLDARAASPHPAARYNPTRVRVPDEDMHDLVGAGAAQALMGASETVILADTSRCFHLGSRVDHRATPRVVVAFQYVTASSFLRSKLAPSFSRIASRDLTEIQRRVLGAT